MSMDALWLLVTDLLAGNHARLMFFTASIIALLGD
jgi:hypothetical protein